MKKLLGIVVLSLLFSGNAYAKKGWAFTYKNYYDTSVSGAAFHKNITKAMNMALSKCQENSKKKKSGSKIKITGEVDFKLLLD